MARQFNRPYEPELNLSSPNTNSPLSPQPRGETPISFRPNVNRAKTKRWVEAKKYSYDGNDWGEDEWDEYDDDPTPPVPQPPPIANQSTGDIPSTSARNAPRPPSTAMDRSRSMDHVATLGVNSGSESRDQSADRSVRGTPSSTMPIVRPADIYRRMQEQQSGPDAPSGSERPSEIPTAVGPSATTEGASKSYPSEREMSGDHLPHQSLSAAADATPTQEKLPENLTVQHDSSAPGLPDVKRLSGFGADFFTGSSSSDQKDQTSESEQGHQLQHNPSFGYRSVVHHAFDVPETPSTSVDSVERSNSGSTSAISPIIGSRAFTSEDKTPTIVEEPESTSPPKDFRFGHRRDLSVPSPGNSPSRQPVVTNNDAVPSSALAEVAINTPADSSGDHPHQPDRFSTPAQSPTNLQGGDRPSPLHINTQLPGETRDNQGVPIIIPSLSTDDSPQDTESDRLRKEIIRSLSRENTPSDEPDQDHSRPPTGRQDSLVPSEYERYWSEHPEPANQEQPQSIEKQPAPASIEPESENRPKIKRRFSWESSSSDEATPVPGVQSPPGAPMPGQFPIGSPPPGGDEKEPGEVERPPALEKPKLTIIPPSAMDSNSISSDRLPEVVHPEPMKDSSPLPEGRSADTDYQTTVPAPTAPPSIETSLLSFRNILEMKTSENRVQAFNETRDQFASINTGLNHWIQVTVHAHPEHTDVVEQSWSLAGAAPKPTVSRGKFPKLPSLGNFGASHPDGSPSGSGHVRRPSAPLGSMMNKQQVEQRGKDLLHTAGVLGGRAGEAAKGLFAKGRSKFKGGNEKVEP
ncbi:hypothetical protein BDV59DRAFT_46402 [Aspergillus ambiguus]|uniref:uncharacterized protein n=1 Tax=Aspergillus ambiguus TaxID=176160 RepID=UPI003CCCE28E